MAAQVRRARARAARRRPRRARGGRGRAPTSATCGSARRTARSATSTRRSPTRGCGSSAASGPASRCAPCDAAGGRLAAPRARRCGARSRTVEITPLDYAIRAHEILEDAQRDMLSGVAAPYSGAGVRATAASLRATYAVIGTLRALLAERGALAPVETGLLGLRRELDAIRRAHGGTGRRSTRSRTRERQRLNGRLGAGLEMLADGPARARDAVRADDPGAAAVKLNRRRFLSRGALALGAVAAGEAVAASDRRTPRRRRRARPADRADPVRRRAPGGRAARAARRGGARRRSTRSRPTATTLSRRRWPRSAPARRELTQGTKLRIGEPDEPPRRLRRARHRHRAGRADGHGRLRALAVRRALRAAARRRS